MKKRSVILFAVCGIALFTLNGCEEKDSDEFEAYYSTVSDEDVQVNAEANFVDSQLLLTAVDGVSKKEIEEMIKPKDGSIVGYISITNDYQIEFNEGKTLDELNAIVEEWKKNENIEAVTLNYASRSEMLSVDYTKDPWIDAEKSEDTSGMKWDENNPDGSNWWAEAIQMPSVWEMDEEFEPVKVGIIDTMFDIENEDLQDAFVENWNAQEDEDGNCNVTELYQNASTNSIYYHGTHVAGLIAAKAENGFGIAGVSQNAELYGYSYMPASEQSAVMNQWDDLFEAKYAMALMLEKGVKVINLSLGDGEMMVAAQNGAEKALDALDKWSTSYERFFSKCLNQGYDFLLVHSAGNDNGYNWVTCEMSDEHPYGYRKDGNTTDNDIPNYRVEYDIFAAIENEEVEPHILIVGAAENDMGNYWIAPFNEIGEQIDVYAPGVDILSDLPSNITGLKTGTSMATPIVSGIASLVWGVNPELSAEQVADIIRSSANVTFGDSTKPSSTGTGISLVNAYYAVRLAMSKSGDGDNNPIASGIITGMPYVIDEDGSYEEIENITVTVTNAEGETVESIVTENYTGYTFVLPAATYTITAEGERYVSVSKEVSLGGNEVINVDFEMESIFNAKLSELISTFGAFKSVQNGTMSSPQDEWLKPYGVMGATIMDFDSDGEDEMLVSIAEKCEHDTSNTQYHIILHMFEMENGSIIEKDTILFGAYYANGDLPIEVTLALNEWCEDYIGIHTINTEDYPYIICEYQNHATFFADGMEQSYWILEYKDETFRYVASFTQTNGGSSNFEFTFFTFENGTQTGAQVYYSEWYDASPLFTDYGQAVKEFFSTYGVILQSQVDNWDTAYDGINNIGIVLSPENELTLNLEFTNQIKEEEIRIPWSNSRVTYSALLDYSYVYPDGNTEEDGVSLSADNEPDEQNTLDSDLYANVLSQYSGKSNTRYDINKDGKPELIIEDEVNQYTIYSYDGSTTFLCGTIYSSYDDCLYEYDGNGILVHDGGEGSMHLEYVFRYALEGNSIVNQETVISTEEYTEAELNEYLSGCDPINNFQQ